MLRPSRLFFLAVIVGVAYVIWRQRRTQTAEPATFAPPIAPPPLSPPVASPPPAAEAPKRIVIPTRVHRGAPPTLSKPAPSEAETPVLGERAEAMPIDTSPAVEQVSTEAGTAEPPVEVLATVGDDGVPEASPHPGDAPLEVAAPDAPGEPPMPITVSGNDSVPESGAEETLPDAELLDINKADLAALIALPGIGPVIAKRIITYRNANGPFSSIDELIDVQGVGRNNINEFRHLVKV